MILIRSKAFSVCTALLTGIIACYSTINAFAEEGEAGEGIHVSSEPSGADLYVMGNHVGTTPMTISEQDIYPTSYKAETEKFYGKVFLLKTGCEEYSKRLTRADIKSGLTARLVCSTGEAVTTSPQSPGTPATPSSAAPVLAPTPQAAYQADQESLSERKLKQLKSLLQLLDEGLMSREEEERLRRRILDDL